MRTIKFKCPNCSNYLAPVESMDSATQIVKRTCRRCKTTWQIKVRLLGSREINETTAHFDEGDFTRLVVRSKSNY